MLKKNLRMIDADFCFMMFVLSSTYLILASFVEKRKLQRGGNRKFAIPEPEISHENEN